jgi:hypothetical protein
MPQIRTDSLSHANSIAGISAARRSKDGRAFPIVALHIFVGFESAASEDDGAPCSNAPISTRAADDDAA